MELIKISDQNGKQVVSARELYKSLGYDTSQFSRWAKKNILENTFSIENEDYARFDIDVEGNIVPDYALTLDFSKKLCMLSKTKIGEQVRDYFISCEKKALQPKQLSRLELLELAMKSEKERLKLEEKVTETTEQLIQANQTILLQAPKVQFVNEVLNSESAHTTTLIAKELGMSAEMLNRELSRRDIQYFHNKTWVLKAKYQNKGYTKTKTHTYHDSEGKVRTSMLTVWTESGRAFIHSIMNPMLNNTLKPTKNVW